jgi:hypothetical protein
LNTTHGGSSQQPGCDCYLGDGGSEHYYADFLCANGTKFQAAGDHGVRVLSMEKDQV